MQKIQKGFTLIELMIVVAIIGILAAVAIPAYQDYVVKAKLSKVQSTMDSVKLALAMYSQENGSFPNDTITTGTTAAVGNLWSSIGLAAGTIPTLPNEVELLSVNGTNQSSVFLKLKIKGNTIKAGTIDNLDLALAGRAMGTAVTWECVKADGSTASGIAGAPYVTSITDPIALKYFQCQ